MCACVCVRMLRQTHRAVVSVQAGVISLQDVALLEVVRLVVFDMFGKLLIRSEGSKSKNTVHVESYPMHHL